MQAHFDQQAYEATPGQPQLLTLRITNDEPTPASYSIGVVGLDPGVVRFPRRVGPVPAGRAVEIPLPVDLPVGFAAGEHRIAVEVTSDRSVSRPVLATTTLSVGSASDLLLSLGPRNVRGGWRGKFDVNLANRSQRPLDVTLEGEGDDLRFSFKHNPIEVRPGESVRIRSKVYGPRPLADEHPSRPFTVSARGHSSPVHTVGTFVRRSILPAGVGRAALFLGIILLWGVGLFFAWRVLRDADPSSDEDVAGEELASDGASGNGTDGTGTDGDGDGSDGDGDTDGDGSGSDDEIPPEFSSTIGGFVTAGESGDDADVVVVLQAVALDDVSDDPDVTLVGFQSGNSDQKSFAGRAGRGQTGDDGAPDVRQTVSADDGEWGFADIDRRGLYRLDFSKAGYDPKAFIVSFPEDGPLELDVALDPGAGTISGTVIGPGGGPIGGVAIELTDGTLTLRASTSTEAATLGQFTLANLGTPQHYLLTAIEPGFATDVRAVDLEAGGSASVTIELVTGVETLRGTISSGGVPIGGARITVTDGDFERSTTSATAGVPGTFSLPGLPIGRDYLVTIEADGFLPVTLSISLVTGADALAINLSRDSVVVEGLVTGVDPATGDDLGPLSGTGITVAVDGGDVVLKSTSDTDGTFTLSGLAPGSYVLTFSKFKYNDASVLLDLDTASPPSFLNITLDFDPDQGVVGATGELTGTIRSSTNNDFLGNAVVIVVTSTGERLCNLDTTANPDACNIEFSDVVAAAGSLGGTSIADGGYTILNIPVGIHDVFIFHHLHQEFRAVKSFGIGTRETLDATLLELGSIRGTVQLAGNIAFTEQFFVSIAADPSFAAIDGVCSVGPPQSFQSIDGSYDYDAADLVPCHYLATFTSITYVDTVVPFVIVAGQQGEVTVDAVMRREPRATVSVFIPTRGPGTLTSGGVNFDQTTDATVVTGITINSPVGVVEAVVDAGNNQFRLRRIGVAANSEFLPQGAYEIVINSGAAYRDNAVNFTLTADQVADLQVPLAPIPPLGGDFGGDIFYRTPDLDTRAIPTPEVVISAPSLLVDFDEDIDPATAPIGGVFEDLNTTSITSSTADPASAWNTLTASGRAQVWGTSTYSFTHDAFEPAGGSATVDILVDDIAPLSVSNESNLVATVQGGGAGPIDIELDPLPGNVTGRLDVFTIATQTDSQARLGVEVDNLDDPAAAVTATLTNTVDNQLADVYQYDVANAEPGQYQAQVVGADFQVHPAFSPTATGFLDPAGSLSMVNILGVYELGRITVEVTDLSGNPISGASVTISDATTTASDTTPAGGSVELTRFAVDPTIVGASFVPTPYNAAVTADGFLTVPVRPVQLVPGGFIDDDGTVDNKITIALEPLQTITGSALGIPDANNPTATVPLDGAVITYRRLTTGVGDACTLATGFVEATTTSDANGDWIIADEQGDYYLCSIAATGFVELINPPHPTNATRLLTIGSAAGALPDTVDGGSYSLLAAEGDIDIRVIDDGNNTLGQGSGSRATACLLEAGVVITNVATGCPTGDNFGPAGPGANGLPDTVAEGDANGSGEISFVDVDATTYKLLIFANGHLSLILPVTVPPGGLVDLNTSPIVLKRQGASIDGRVYVVNTSASDTELNPCSNARNLGTLGGATVSLFGGDLQVAGARATTLTVASGGNQGKFSFSDLEDGTYTASVSAPLPAGIDPFTTPSGWVTISGQNDEKRDDFTDINECPIFVVAQDGTPTIVLFDDINGDGNQDTGEGALTTNEQVIVEFFHPNDPTLTSPIASVAGTTPNGDGVVLTSVPISVPALSLATADLNDDDNRYIVRVRPQGSSTFLAPTTTTSMTPASSLDILVGVFNGVAIQGTVEVQATETGAPANLDINNHPRASVALVAPDGSTIVATEGTSGSKSIQNGAWRLEVAASQLPASPGVNGFSIFIELGDDATPLTEDYVPITVDKDIVPDLGNALPSTLTIPLQTLIKKGELDINAGERGATVTVAASNGPANAHPDFAVPAVGNTLLSSTEATPPTPNDPSDDTYTFTLGSGAMNVDIDVDPRWDYTVTSSKTDFADDTVGPVSVDIGGSTDVNLSPRNLLGTVRVRVRAPNGTTNLNNADVTIRAKDLAGNDQFVTDDTNGSGIAVFNNNVFETPAGTMWDVFVDNTIYPQITFVDELTIVGDTNNGTIIVVIPGGSLTSSVTMAPGSTFPASGFTADIDGTGAPGDQTITTNGGSVTFTGLRDDDYDVTLTPVGGNASDYSFSPANGTTTTIPNAEASADQNIDYTATALARVEVSLDEPDGSNLTSATAVQLLPPTGPAIVLLHDGSGVWSADDVPALATGSYDVFVDSIFPDFTQTNAVSFSAPGTVQVGPFQLNGGSISVTVSGAAAGDTYTIALSGGTVSPTNQTVTIGTTPGNTVTFDNLEVATWTATVSSVPTGWQTSVSGTATVSANGTVTGSPITVTASNPAPTVGTVTAADATVNDDPCTTTGTNTSTTVTTTITGVASGDLTVVLSWTGVGGGPVGMTFSAGTGTWSATFDPANFTADATATLTVTATDTSGDSDTGTTTVDLIATCP